MSTAREQLWIDDLNGARVRIPYVAMWTSEASMRIAVHDDLGPLMVSSGARGLGSPVLGKMDPHRQRESVANGWCQVCARALPPGPRCAVFIGGQPVRGWRHPRTGEVFDTCRLIEPWACSRCLLHAIEHCPGIARSAEYVIKMRRWETEVAFTDVRELIDEDLRVVDGVRHDIAIGYAKIVPLLFRLIPLAGFVARAKRRKGRA